MHRVFLFASLRVQTGALGGEFSSGIEKERKKTYIIEVSDLEFKWSPLESEHVKLVTRKVSKRVLTHWQLLAAWYITWSWSLVPLQNYAQSSMTFSSHSCPNTSSTISRHHQQLYSLHIFSGSWYAVIEELLLVCCNPDSPDYWRVIDRAGLSKERGMWRRTRCAAIAKSKNSSDPAAYAHSWVQKEGLSASSWKLPYTFHYLGATRGSMSLNAQRANVAT